MQTIGTVAIVGVGLIGGSVGLALSRRRIARRIIGIDPHDEARAEALRRGAVNEATGDFNRLCEADVVVLAAPVQHLPECIRRASGVAPDHALLMDTGSIKGWILGELAGLPPQGPTFVAAHPLAGSEKQGVAHADADLFVNKLTILTPGPTPSPAALDRAEEFWQALGARTRIMAAEDHDRAVAFISHLPHLLASALAGSVPAHCLALAASGFRDATRLAAGGSELWSGILQHNAGEVLRALGALEERLGLFRDALAAQDQGRLHSLLEEGKRVRDALGN